jgi:HSP20 family molecular chaperone IbpA
MATNNKHIDPELLKTIRSLHPEAQSLADSARDFLAERRAEVEKLFPGINKYTLGYSETIADMMEHINSASKDNYPFHKISARHVYKDNWATSCIYEITISVAGFGKDDISVEVLGDVLYIDGDAPKASEEFIIDKNPDDLASVVLTETLMYNGIAARDFHRSFLLKPHMEVKNVVLNDGILTIIVREEYPTIGPSDTEGVRIPVNEGMSNIPTLYIDKAEPNPSHPGAEIVSVYCDECLKYHTHGMPNGNDGTYEASYRSPHCINKNGKYSNGYFIGYKKIVEA